MNNQFYWRPGDGRSLRRDRVPFDMRILGRIVPQQPLDIVDTHEGWAPLRELAVSLERALGIVEAHVPELVDVLQLSNGHYPEVAALPFGGQQREMLTTGMYVLTDSGPAQRILYVGSGSDSTVRARVISHLFARRRLGAAQAAYRQMLESWGEFGYPPVDEADAQLRTALFGRNRWSESRPNARGWRRAAAELIAAGAFDVAMLSVPDGYGPVARCMERYVTEWVRSKTGKYPPLNGQPVVLDSRLRLGRMTPSQIAGLFDALSVAARTPVSS
jgi:hypothetical protein